ncbi:Zn(II)2Cys6 transcription factor [Aspergillus stella-maris]|uniref:Zn(II)2Cys6 transcription factor n=1 Tax=Aspergillus stella-maris TaxID=1810926 RepID=UPI003CCCF463
MTTELADSYFVTTGAPGSQYDIHVLKPTRRPNPKNMSARRRPAILTRPQQPTQSTYVEPSSPIRSPTSPVSGPRRKVTKGQKRSKDGCYTCRLRRKKCDEKHPICSACSTLGVNCQYERPSWWVSLQAQKLHRERIRVAGRQVRAEQRDKALHEYIRDTVPSSRTQQQPPANTPQVQPTETVEQTPMFIPSTPFLPTPTSASLLPGAYGYDAGIGSSNFVPVADNLALLQDPNAFYFNPMPNPMLPTPTSAGTTATNASLASPAVITTTSTATAIATTTPALPNSDDWYQGFSNPLASAQDPITLQSAEFPEGPLSYYLEAKMSSNERERYLLYHFVDNVLRLVFPILDLHKQGPSRARDILHSLETNISYYHCCLSVAAIHLKTVKKQRGKRVENDIMRHRYAAVSKLNKALYADNGHDTILDATLAMIFFHCSVGSPEVDSLPDIAWSDHFTAVTDLVEKLNLHSANPYIIPPFSVSLSSWIDIFGATMLGKSPKFAHKYREKHLKGVSSGLRELMGCEDRIMYLISEIACLDFHKESGRLNDMEVASYVAGLMAQLDHAEQATMQPHVESPTNERGTIDPDKLTKNMTTMFRLAARVYLHSLSPGFHPEQQAITELVETIATNLQYIPAGAHGFDRSLVWPMLITGVNSTPTSNFRIILEQRIAAMGDCADFGSFGRMYAVLQETWSLSDDLEPEPVYSDLTKTFPSAAAPSAMTFSFEGMGLLSPSMAAPDIAPRVKKQPIHWRDVMKLREWQYLLL